LLHLQGRRPSKLGDRKGGSVSSPHRKKQYRRCFKGKKEEKEPLLTNYKEEEDALLPKEGKGTLNATPRRGKRKGKKFTYLLEKKEGKKRRKDHIGSNNFIREGRSAQIPCYDRKERREKDTSYANL